MTESEKFNLQATIIEQRSAFAAYMQGGINEVLTYHPDAVNFVYENYHKTLEEVTELLTRQLDEITLNAYGNALRSKVAS